MAAINVTLIAGTGIPPLDFVVGDTVGLGSVSAGDTYAWEFLDKPDGSAAVILNDDQQNATFVVDIPGTYYIQLVRNANDVGRALAAAPFIVPDPIGTLRPPASGEMFEGDLLKGWSREVQKLFTLQAGAVGSPALVARKEVDLTVVGQTPIFTLPSGKIFVAFKALLLAKQSAGALGGATLSVGQSPGYIDLVPSTVLTGFDIAGEVWYWDLNPAGGLLVANTSYWGASAAFDLDVTVADPGASTLLCDFLLYGVLL